MLLAVFTFVSFAPAKIQQCVPSLLPLSLFLSLALQYEKPFGPWDFKTAIFGTLIQALKAIGGGVLALKGQIVKGSGFLLAAKSKVLGKTGDVITSFGKQLASSAVLKPYPAPIPDGYTYEQHPVHHIGEQ